MKVSNKNLNNENLNDLKTLNIELDDTLFKFIDANDAGKNQITLAGKPRLLIVDIVRRFCKNYVALTALIMIIIISFTCLIIPITSPFSATNPIANISNVWLTQLPPSYSPIVTESLNKERADVLISLQQLNPQELLIIGWSPENWTPTEINNNFLITYNKYLFIRLYSGSNINVNSLLGTNMQGVDIWTRTWTAARDSITLSFLVATTDAILGITVGCFLGFYAGKWIDTVLTRIIDIIINIPTLVWFLMLMTIVGKGNINPFSLYFILISIGWVYMVNTTRLWMITVKDQEFILAAKAIGCSTQRQIFVHGLPMIIGKLSTNYVRRIVTVILSISSLVFLGFLDSSDDPNLGTLLKESIPILDINFWGLLLPSIILLSFSLSAQFVANGLHDALDPKVERGK
ncbi:MAG: ABC transporter permease [Mycoplasma sp.]|nr:ABC transporter permease [Mycoplasma sp.]